MEPGRHKIDYAFARAGWNCLVVDKIMYGNEKGLSEPSRETKFSGVHKDSWAAREPGARALANPSRTVLKSCSKTGDPRASSCARIRACKNQNIMTFESNKMLVQIKKK